MGRILNTNWKFWDGTKKQTVPAPCDPSTPDIDWLYNRLAKNASNYKRSGYTAVSLPPSTKTQGGQANDADGYGLFDPYDLGNKNQCYSKNTRFGTLEQLRRLVAINNANGLDTYSDYVFHQRDGGRAGVYQFPSATGKLNGRWPLTPSCFGYDPVWSNDGNYAFGDRCAYVVSTPEGYMADNAVGNLDWMVRTTGFKGVRLDDVKGANSEFVQRLATARSMGGIFKMGECFVGNNPSIDGWLQSVGYSCSAIDFPVHWRLQDICDNGRKAGDLLANDAAYFKWNPFHSVSYVESADTDNSPGQQIVNNKGLCYWYLLTSEGYPQVYYRDYAHDPHCYGLSKIIDNLLWIHANVAYGGTIPRIKNDQSVAAFERTGGAGLISAANFDSYNNRWVSHQTNHREGDILHDYSGHRPDIRVGPGGVINYMIPCNAYNAGIGFVCYALPGYTQAFSLEKRHTVQEFFGADDLDISAAVGGGTVESGRVWCDAGTRIDIIPSENSKGLTVGILNQDGTKVSLNANLQAEAARRGFYSLTVTAVDPQPYDYAVSYTATQDLHDSEV